MVLVKLVKEGVVHTIWKDIKGWLTDATVSLLAYYSPLSGPYRFSHCWPGVRAFVHGGAILLTAVTLDASCSRV